MINVFGWFILLFFGFGTFLNVIDMIVNNDEDSRYMAVGRIITLSPVLYYTYATMFGAQ